MIVACRVCRVLARADSSRKVSQTERTSPRGSIHIRAPRPPRRPHMPTTRKKAKDDDPTPLLSEEAAPNTSVTFILSASAPAILNNVAAPLAAALQLGLLGHSSSSHEAAAARVAAFTAVNAATAFVANVSNFLIVVTMARVGHALGARQWVLLGQMVRAVLLTAVVVGSLSAVIMWMARAPLLAALSPAGDETALTEAAAYLPAALLKVPPLLLLRAGSSVLVGYQRVRLAAMINAGLALVDTLAFYVALHVLGFELRALGLLVAVTCGATALVSVGLLLWLPPDPSVRVCPCASGGAREEALRSVAEGEDEGDGDGDGGGGDGDGEGEAPAAASLLSLACDSLNVLLRSLLLQGSVLALTLGAAPLGTTALNAHAVLLQLWMLTSYVVDGFADVGTMLGSKLLGAGRASEMRRLTRILAALGLATGLAAALLLLALRDTLAAAFTRHPATRGLLTSGALWPLLCALQPVNSLVFVYDGLLYATRSFAYVRNALALGMLLVFAPALALVLSRAHTLLGIWAAKACLNSWRCATALVRIHWQLWPQWRADASRVPAEPPPRRMGASLEDVEIEGAEEEDEEYFEGLR